MYWGKVRNPSRTTFGRPCGSALGVLDHRADGPARVVGRDDDVPEARVERRHRRGGVCRVHEHRVPPDRPPTVQQHRQLARDLLLDLAHRRRELLGGGDTARDLEVDEEGRREGLDRDDGLGHDGLLPYTAVDSTAGRIQENSVILLNSAYRLCPSSVRCVCQLRKLPSLTLTSNILPHLYSFVKRFTQ